MESHSRDQAIITERNSKAENTEWKTIGVKIRVGELPLLNRQLARFNYNTLGARQATFFNLPRSLVAPLKLSPVRGEEQERDNGVKGTVLLVC